MKMRMVGLAAVLLGFPAAAFAVINSYVITIPWTPGAGQKSLVNCNTKHFVHGIENYDQGGNTVYNHAKCGNVSNDLPGLDVRHSGCTTVNVPWTPGAGFKPWAHCPNGKAAVGFAINDYGGRNEGINKMRCCGIAEGATIQADSYDDTVSWFGGPAGSKGYTECEFGYVVTGVRLRDYGGNNQAVSDVTCSIIDIE